LALHQQAADEFGRNLLGGAGEKGWGSAGKVLVAMGVAWVGKGKGLGGRWKTE